MQTNSTLYNCFIRGSVLFIAGILAASVASSQCTFTEMGDATLQVSSSFQNGGIRTPTCPPINQSFFASPGNKSVTQIWFEQTPETNPGIRIWGMNTVDSIEIFINGIRYPLNSSTATVINNFSCAVSPNDSIVAFA